jgi:hypothetical protein
LANIPETRHNFQAKTKQEAVALSRRKTTPKGFDCSGAVLATPLKPRGIKSFWRRFF